MTWRPLTQTEIDTTTTTIMRDGTWRNATGARYDRDGDYLGPTTDEGTRWLATTPMAIDLFPGCTRDDIRNAVATMMAND